MIIFRIVTKINVPTRIPLLFASPPIRIIRNGQNVKRALKIGNHVYRYANGKGVFDGKPEELLAHPELSKLYLGIT